MKENWFTVRNIPPEVRKEFKVACAKEGLTQSKVIVHLMKEYIRIIKEKR
jgi:hypothetical protein